MRSPYHLGRSSEAKNRKNPKKVKCDGPKDGLTDRQTDKAGCRVAWVRIPPLPPCQNRAILCFLIKDLLCFEHDSHVASTNETFKAIHLLISCYFYSTTKNEVNPTRAQERVKSTYSQNLSSGNFFRL